MIYRSAFGLPGWNIRNAFEELNRMRRQMDHLFDSMSTGSQVGYRSGVFPALNLTEDKDAYHIRAELPGMTADMLQIEATGKKLSISGQRQIPSAGQNAKYHRRERESGHFSRVITVPGEIESAMVEAALTNGILTVTLPKAQETKPRQISIR
jgi:HSP20 family protein